MHFIFGESLQAQEKKGAVPRFLKKILRLLNTEESLHTEGIFRTNADSAVVEHLKKVISKGGDVELQRYNPHVWANLLKLYFRELPEPLLTFRLFNDFIAPFHYSTDFNVRLSQIRHTLHQLPETHFAVCSVLMLYLCRVVEYSDFNRMNAANLGIVFGPNLLWPVSEDLSIDDSHNVNSVIQYLIEYYDFMFQLEEEMCIDDVPPLPQGNTAADAIDCAQEACFSEIAVLLNQLTHIRDQVVSCVDVEALQQLSEGLHAARGIVDNIDALN
eukprot:GCRY01003575.1.p1 GENE.GCRY01003575.1~~GCRY01003575.1.p1  ORF type:complete len:272 (+),score=42.69 GCRY01003575.1:228-1043(+)